MDSIYFFLNNQIILTLLLSKYLLPRTAISQHCLNIAISVPVAADILYPIFQKEQILKVFLKEGIINNNIFSIQVLYNVSQSNFYSIVNFKSSVTDARDFIYRRL